MRSLGPAPDSFYDEHGVPRFGAYQGALPPVDLEPLASSRVELLTKRKRWVYLAVATDEVLIAAAAVHVGYAATAFAFVFDRESRRLLADRSATWRRRWGSASRRRRARAAVFGCAPSARRSIFGGASARARTTSTSRSETSPCTRQPGRWRELAAADRGHRAGPRRHRPARPEKRVLCSRRTASSRSASGASVSKAGSRESTTPTASSRAAPPGNGRSCSAAPGAARRSR